MSWSRPISRMLREIEHLHRKRALSPSQNMNHWQPHGGRGNGPTLIKAWNQKIPLGRINGPRRQKLSAGFKNENGPALGKGLRVISCGEEVRHVMGSRASRRWALLSMAITCCIQFTSCLRQEEGNELLLDSQCSECSLHSFACVFTRKGR